MIKKCNCTCKGQDKLHGKGMRVMNQTFKSKVGAIYRCTVCLVESNEKAS